MKYFKKIDLRLIDGYDYYKGIIARDKDGIPIVVWSEEITEKEYNKLKNEGIKKGSGIVEIYQMPDETIKGGERK